MNTIDSLREALQFSPENIPLRMHLAKVLYMENKFQEAIEEYKVVLEKDSSNFDAKCGLAQSSYAAGNHHLAFVVLEDVCSQPNADAELHVMLAKLLLKENKMSDAGHQYRKAIEKNPAIADSELDKEFRTPANQQTSGMEEESVQDDMAQLARRFSMERPDINFDHVGGMEKVKEEIRMKIIHPLSHPELYSAYGKKIGGGILLYGPPGCGKTYLARATAGQVKARFISVGIHDILDMWIGNSEKNLHGLFELARANTPCVLFFDEVDALAASRSDMKHSGARHLINQFLQELDGVDSNNDGVLILAATNAPWNLDSAFRRPGRFDRIVFVSPPDVPARAEILKVILTGKPQSEIKFDEVASKCTDFSGADLKALVDLTIEKKLADAFKTGIPEPITTKDLLQVAKEIKPSTKDWFVQAKNYAMYANESGNYTDILDYINRKK